LVWAKDGPGDIFNYHNHPDPLYPEILGWFLSRRFQQCDGKRKNLFIEVIDCGCGIPAEKREEIFAPFFTTKQGGTGLGLPIAKRIVEAHQGYLEVQNNFEKGVTFKVIISIG
jgi:signal transduction histidine kinase